MKEVQKKSIAVITFHSWINGNLNYGATLQAFALVSVLDRMGHDVELIDYIPEVVPAKRAGKTLYRRLFRYGVSRKIPVGKRNGFKNFLQENCRLGVVRYNSLKQLNENPPAAEIYVAGSDQVWNPSIFHDILFRAFFLDFGQPSKRISYASSFGSDQAERGFEREMAGLLKRFLTISVREESGTRIVKKLLGEDAKVSTVLDPTLLIDDYSKTMMPMNTKGTLLAYFFSPSCDDISILKEVAMEMGLEPAIIGDAGTPRWDGCRTMRCNSPAQWIGAIYGAEAIVTHSFHGTAFSILFQKPFVSLTGDVPGKVSRSTRVLDLVSKLGVHSQVTTEWSASNWAKILRKPIDWPKTHALLSQERKVSLEYLRKAIEGRWTAEET